MRLDALLSDVMTAERRATLAIVTASSTCTGRRQRGGRDSNRIFTGLCVVVPPTGEGLYTWDAHFFDPRSWSLHWPGRWSAGSGTFWICHVQRRGCLWIVPPPPLCYTVRLVCPGQCLPQSRRIASADGRASSKRHGVKRDAGRCPRLPEQRPNRGVLRAAASRRAGPHPPQILTGRGDGFLIGGPGNSETWCGDGPGRGRFASENAAAHTGRFAGRYRQR